MGSYEEQEGRPWKNLSDLNSCPINIDPLTTSPSVIRLPFDCAGKTRFAASVTASGYSSPVISVMKKRYVSAIIAVFDVFMIFSFDEIVKKLKNSRCGEWKTF